MDYVDLYLLHQPYGDVAGAWKALEEAKAAGKIRSIGVSNMTPKIWNEFVPQFETLPAVNQVECHPFFQQRELRALLAGDDVKIEAYQPLGHGDASLLSHPAITALAEKYGKNAGQVILRFAQVYQPGTDRGQPRSLRFYTHGGRDGHAACAGYRQGPPRPGGARRGGDTAPELQNPRLMQEDNAIACTLNRIPCGQNHPRGIRFSIGENRVKNQSRCVPAVCPAGAPAYDGPTPTRPGQRYPQESPGC